MNKNNSELNKLLAKLLSTTANKNSNISLYNYCIDIYHRLK